MGLEYVACIPKSLPEDQLIESSQIARSINPANAPEIAPVMALFGDVPSQEVIEQRLAVLTTKYWSPKGVDRSVGFMSAIPENLAQKILAMANNWGKYANIKYRMAASVSQADVRIAFRNEGYYSYLGTDTLSIPRSQHTMNLQGFDRPGMPESEYLRVVQHEFGHDCAMPHEHMRPEIINRLDPQKTILWGAQVLGWNQTTVIQQILTPLDEHQLKGTEHADQISIMCYDLPASITKDGLPVLGGKDLSTQDKLEVGILYPLTVNPKPPPIINPGNKISLCKTILNVVQLFRNGNMNGSQNNILDVIKSLGSLIGPLTQYLGDIVAITVAKTPEELYTATKSFLKKLAAQTTTQVDDEVIAFIESTPSLEALIIQVIGQFMSSDAADRAMIMQSLEAQVQAAIPTPQSLNISKIVMFIQLILELINQFKPKS